MHIHAADRKSTTPDDIMMARTLCMFIISTIFITDNNIIVVHLILHYIAICPLSSIRTRLIHTKN